VSSWCMIVDIDFRADAPAFSGPVQVGSNTHAAITGTIAEGEGCVQTADIPANDYCLPDDANTNSLAGVCETWNYQCQNAAGCDQSTTYCYNNLASADASAASDNDFCYTLRAFTKPDVGSVGDEVGVLIWTGTPTKEIPGIRIGKKVETNSDADQG
jgi:hypothetical protein